MAPFPPAKTYRVALKKDMTPGHEIAAVQLALNAVLDSGLAVDGSFGKQTLAAVRAFQEREGLKVDGIAGSATQRILGLKLIEPPSKAERLPAGLLKGLTEGESGFIAGCVNWTVAGGVDCSYIQDRVYTSEYPFLNRWLDAFGEPSILETATKLRATKDRFYLGSKYPGAKTHKRAWQLAVLFHNWEYGADRLAKGLSVVANGADQPAAWVLAIGVAGVRTPQEWADFYIESKLAYVTTFGA